MELSERRQRLGCRGGRELLRWEGGLARLGVVNVAEADPQVRRSRASRDTAELFALADLVRGDCCELVHRQAADLELLDAQLAQVSVGCADSGLAVDHGALAQSQQRVRAPRREHLALRLPDLGQELQPQPGPYQLPPVPPDPS